MKENLLSALKAHDFTAIRNICLALSEEERTATLALFEYHTIKALLTDELKKQGITYIPKGISTILSYALICLYRNAEELKAAEINIRIRNLDKEHYCYFLDTQYAVPLLELLQSPKGTYLQEIIEKMYKAYPMDISFEILWTLYKHKRIAFNGELMMFNLHYRFDYERNKIALAKYLLQNPETATEIFHLVPMYLKDARFNAKETLEMYEYLIQGGFFADRTIISLFIEGLLNPLKKNTADFFCRVVELLNPIAKELLTSQHTLFALLSSDKTSVINFAMKHIKQIAEEKAFDFQSFADNFALCFATQKIAKSQLVGLDILENNYKKQPPVNIDYREQLAVLFTVPDVKLQEKVANLLTTYFGGEGLTEVVAPYRDYLKIPQPVPLSEKEEAGSKEDVSALLEDSLPLEVGKLEVPTTAEDLLFLLGDCIREGTAATIDLFFEGLVQLQESLPANYTKELAPYLKKLMKSHYLDSVTTIIKGFLYCYSHQKPLEIPPYQYTYEESNALREKLDEAAFEEYLLWDRLYKHKIFMPFLFHKAQLTLKYLNEKEVLPFLSTPTHEPFYIDTEIFVDKLLQYEAVNKQPDLHDLIVACNRLLFREVSATAKEKARQLKGTYAPAIQYYLGLTDKVQPTEEFLPLWTQITRIKHPDREFPEFENTSAKDIPSVVKPYYIGYGWTKWRDRDMFTFHNYDVGYDEKSEKGYWIGHYRNSFSPFYYNACGGSTPLSTEVNYLLSLNPHYPDAILCGYIANNACGAEEIRNMLLPLEAVLRYDLRVHHSGWLYIGACLLYDKRPSRDLAYEYILQALARGEDLHYVGRYLSDALAMHFSPINRFVEFLDRPTRDPKLKAFQRKVVTLYLDEAKKQDKLPRNHKKLVEFSL